MKSGIPWSNTQGRLDSSVLVVTRRHLFGQEGPCSLEETIMKRGSGFLSWDDTKKTGCS
jgi:hypothetical protein